MTRGEQLVLDDANEFVRQTSEQLEEQDQSTGIRPHPLIEETQTVLQSKRFGLGFSPPPGATAEPGASTPPPTPVVCNLLPVKFCRSKTVTQSKIGFTNLGGDCAGGFGTGLYYTSVSYDCWPWPPGDRHLGGGDADNRFYLSVSGILSECVARHIHLGTGCFGHPGSPSGDCGCGGTGTISYSLLASPSGGTAIDPSIGNGLADISSCSGSITNVTTYTCADFDVNSLFDASISDYGDSITLTDEYTTEQLIADATAALDDEDYTGSWLIGDCNAQRHLADGEQNIYLERVQYQFTFEASPTDCTLKWRERTTDLDGNCLFDTIKSTLVHTGDTETEIFEMMEPESNGFVKIVADCCCDDVCAVLSQGDCANLDCEAFTEVGRWMDSTCATGCDDDDCI